MLEDKVGGLTFTIPSLKRLGEWCKLAPLKGPGNSFVG